MQRYIDLDSFSAVGAGQVANLVLATGVRYDEIHLESNQISEIEYVRLTLNAVEVFRLSKSELEMLETYEGRSADSGYLTLPLSMIGAERLESQLMTGLVTGPGDNVVLEVKFTDSANSPVLKGFANTEAHSGVRSLVRRFVSYRVPVTAAGEVDFTSIVKGPRVLRMWFKSADVTKLEIKQDFRVVYELTKARNDYLLAKRAGKSLIPGYFIFDSTKRNFPVVDAMMTSFQNLNFRLTMSAGSQNVEVLVEQLEAVEPKDWRTV